MKAKNNNLHIVWIAFSELNDWFSQLGGAARYRNFYDSDLGVLMIVLLRAKLHDRARWDDIIASKGHSLKKPYDEASMLIPGELIDHAGSVLESVLACLDKVDCESGSEKQGLLIGVAQKIESGFGKDLPTIWREVISIIEPVNTP